jgi:hypothetical protein
MFQIKNQTSPRTSMPLQKTEVVPNRFGSRLTGRFGVMLGQGFLLISQDKYHRDERPRVDTSTTTFDPRLPPITSSTAR